MHSEKVEINLRAASAGQKLMQVLLIILLVTAPFKSYSALKIDQNGDVEIGSETNNSSLKLNGQVMVGVPVGAVIDYWGDRNAIPRGFMLCDGQKVSDPESPLNGQDVPDLIGRFIRGSSQKGITGGGYVNNRDYISTLDAGSHSHPMPLSTGMISNPSTAESAAYKQPYKSYAGWDGKVLSSNERHFDMSRSDDTYQYDGQHSHALGGNTEVSGSHRHDVPLPPYTTLLKIIRIK